MPSLVVNIVHGRNGHKQDYLIADIWELACLCG